MISSSQERGVEDDQGLVVLPERPQIGRNPLCKNSLGLDLLSPRPPALGAFVTAPLLGEIGPARGAARRRVAFRRDGGSFGVPPQDC